MNRQAYSIVTLKAVDDGERILEGWATRPSVDRAGDIVEPRGARFRLPLPLLLDHDHTAAIGEVFEAQASDQGIRFRARIAKVTTPGMVKDLCDAAWQMVRAGLRKAVSIGFRAIDAKPIATGLHFLSWDWFELSMCSVPCQPGATIDQIKALDQHGRLSRRCSRTGVVRLTPEEAPWLSRPVAPAAKSAAVAMENDHAVLDAMIASLDGFGAKWDAAQTLMKNGHSQSMHLEIMAAGAKATEVELAALRARLAALEARQ